MDHGEIIAQGHQEAVFEPVPADPKRYAIPRSQHAYVAFSKPNRCDSLESIQGDRRPNPRSTVRRVIGYGRKEPYER